MLPVIQTVTKTNVIHLPLVINKPLVTTLAMQRQPMIASPEKAVYLQDSSAHHATVRLAIRKHATTLAILRRATTLVMQRPPRIAGLEKAACLLDSSAHLAIRLHVTPTPVTPTLVIVQLAIQMRVTAQRVTVVGKTSAVFAKIFLEIAGDSFPDAADP